MKRYLAFVMLYLAMTWWFLCTAVFMAVAMPANLLVKRLNEIVGSNDETVVKMATTGFTTRIH